MRVIREGDGLNYNLRFIHDGAHRYEITTSPHNMDKVITRVWHLLDSNEVLYEDVAGRVKAIRFPGRKY